MSKKITSALISVYYKDGLDPVLEKLSDLGITIGRITKEVTALPGLGATVEYSGFNENIQIGMSVTITNNLGVTVGPLSEGLYVTASYNNAVGDPTVILNATPTSIAVGNTITFGPPGIIYNSNNNPLIGILSTSSQIGVAEEDGFNLQLAVAETQPFESALDIYYETSSSGLVQELNDAVQEGAAALLSFPFDISQVRLQALH